MMLRAARILAILLVTLGFQIHGLAGAMTAAQAATCAALAVPGGEDEPGQAMAEKPSPSCKLIGAAVSACPQGSGIARKALRPVVGDHVAPPVWPKGPEKPPKSA